MITVQILINGKVIFARSATNISSISIKENENNAYKVDTGEIISHVPNDGVCNLAKRLIDTIKE